MITLYLARHGQTEENNAHIFQGHLPGKLTQEGIAQAIKLGQELQTVPFDRIVHSDLERARLSAELIRGDRAIPTCPSILLREIDWGSWTGQTISEAKRTARPTDAESEEMLYERAKRFVAFLKKNFDGETILAVGHGMINRRIVAAIQGLPPNELRTIPRFENCEYRILNL
ncbi:MAG TPA: histidine phosphatase family protein [Candidatus Parabacteroides intestinipullorum]|uniref:Histidine phosphatase family protein n=1 Tax=Candidatus Parabacteroides intestinipullorum TaxID=2838723 RepID=A0A9D2BF69_9BACT|nr:histidine phosphatase family protein [Candidatus Parabacteroides intestinipullorum]